MDAVNLRKATLEQRYWGDRVPLIKNTLFWRNIDDLCDNRRDGQR